MRKNISHPVMGKISVFIGGILLIPACLFTAKLHAQSIISLDTVTVGSNVFFDLSGTDKFHTYAWEFESNTFKQLLTNAVGIFNTGTNGIRFDVSAGATMVYDDGSKKFYGFVSCASSGLSNPNVQRIDFGTNPNNPAPNTVDLGNPGNAFITSGSGYNNMQDIEMVKDNAGIFHAFINNGGVVHWVFGNGLGNPPTQSTRIFTNPSILGMSINMAVINYNTNWYMFIGQSFGTQPGLVRLDLGANLNTIPANIPYHAFAIPSGLDDASYLAVLKQNGNWHINMCSRDANANLIRYSFGTDLLNDNPTISDLGPSNTANTTNRGLNFIKTCDSVTMIGLFQDGTVYKYRYANNDILNPPIPENIGQKFGSSVAMQTLSPYWNNDTLWALSTSYNNNIVNTVFRIPLASFNSNNTSINYYSSIASHTFNTAGVYDVELYCDQGDNRGPQSFCKQIVVVNPTAIGDIDNSINSISIYPNPVINKLNITMPKLDVIEYNICDITGREILSYRNDEATMGQDIHIDLQNYSMKPGFYILNLTSKNGERYSAKFIKK